MAAMAHERPSGAALPARASVELSRPAEQSERPESQDQCHRAEDDEIGELGEHNLADRIQEANQDEPTATPTRLPRPPMITTASEKTRISASAVG